jgi:hypothetical protein
MIYGRDEDGPPIVADEEAAGAITIVETGRRRARRLESLIDALVSNAVSLSSASTPSDGNETESEE